MPNWVQNTIIADKKNYEIIKSKLINDEGKIDFEIMKPMPKDLDIISGGCSFSASMFPNIANRLEELYTFSFNLTRDKFVELAKHHLSCDKFLSEEYIKFINKYKKDEYINTFISGFYNLKKYGSVDWYDWCIANWGTKWNACESVISNEHQCISFQTAWACPYNIIHDLSRYADFTILYADEDIGHNFGISKFKNGKYINLLEKTPKDSNFNHALASMIYGFNDKPEGMYCEDMDEEELKDYRKAYDKAEEFYNKVLNIYTPNMADQRIICNLTCQIWQVNMEKILCQTGVIHT